MTSDAQIKAFIDRILRLKEEQDTIGEDIRDIYAEAKSMGFDKTAMGNVVAHLRKVSKKGHDTVAEQGAIFDLYLAAYEGHAPAPARARENIEKFDREARAKRRTSEAMDDNKAFSAELAAAGLISEEAHAEHVALSDAVARKYGAGVVDHETGEILDDQPRSDGGLNIVTKHTEIASSPQGETASPSAEVEAASANAGGEDVDRSAERATAARNEADATVTPASAFTAKPRSALRPNCRNPEACAGYGDKHCHACTVAKRQQEEVA
ncbi:DUF2312 domain-containing protein [Sinorhizobium americanum]|uniref:Uncharacterized protein n=1 Tax=Sinorhizobium americanum TaxID=194963 RepID=A0A1L3LLZ6_9HYPH|nr:GapR family DNA-binding domain-containing protein [Sinorhizobium americanum]APG91118.1 hypothetical protein SAMCFNEI73_Ch1828 [Sinorhizobium americanum]OAP43700.1 hypothetical protein ATC00_02320 [Sinorhizobium americanum]